MTRMATLLAAGLVALAGCGDDEPSGEAAEPRAGSAAEQKPEPVQPVARGTAITLGDSEFGRMLFDFKRQAIYVFENDQNRKSVCYGECAKAWPPVLTKGRPHASGGVRSALLGTVKRRDGKRQVTYAGKPLYFYAHEGPGEVRCHNVDLNGGLWWVVGPDGKRRP